MLRQTLSLTAALAFVVAGTVTTANAQETTTENNEYAASGLGPEQGSWEAIISGAGTNDRRFENGSFELNGELGYYFTPALEGSIRQGIGFTSVGNDMNYRTGVAVDYHFDMGALRPFVGAELAFTYGDIDNEIYVGPEGGVKWYVQDQTFIYGRVSYEFPTDQELNDGVFNYVVGVGFNF